MELAKINEFGAKDLTAFNAAGLMSRRNFSIEYGGVKFLGLGSANMSPDEVIETLRMLGVGISRKTLYNYEMQGLAPEAIFRNSRTTIYTREVVAETFASYSLLHDKELNKPLKLTPAAVAIVRRDALRAERNPNEMLHLHQEADIVRTFENAGYNLGRLFVIDWLLLKARAEIWPAPPEAKIKLTYRISADMREMTREIVISDKEEMIIKSE